MKKEEEWWMNGGGGGRVNGLNELRRFFKEK